MQSFQPTVFEAHHKKVSQCVHLAHSHPEPLLRELATDFLCSLASKAGNDILEKVLIESTGRRVKAVDQKHGADSEDGEVEAKPMKSGYNAHISDDTPASLLRHQTIPWIVLGEASDDGRTILWSLLCSYRVFDEARYRGLITCLSETDAAEFAAPLPAAADERYKVLSALKKKWKKKTYVRSNALPLDALLRLAPGDYQMWVHPDVSRLGGRAYYAQMEAMATRQLPVNETCVKTATDLRVFFLKQKDEDWDSMSKAQLQDLWRSRGWKGMTSKSREELLERLRTDA